MRGPGEFGAVGADPCALDVEGAGFGGRAAFKHVEIVRRRVPECPHIRGRCQDEIEAEYGQFLGYPGSGGHYARLDVPVGGPGLGGNEREKTLAVRLAQHQVHGLELNKATIKFFQAPQHPVMGKEPAVLLEWVRVDHGEGAGAGVPHVRQERGAFQVTGFTGEGVVLPRCHRLFENVCLTGHVEGSDSCAIGFPPALGREAVRCIQEPKRCPHCLGACMQPEKTAHGNPLLRMFSGGSPQAVCPWAWVT
ncbi:hypothetical protein PJL18_02464 [Paenarthrobacter nicotinovorans]|nr:hypothetical protein [Paenarthrobacter nicotinovorans]